MARRGPGGDPKAAALREARCLNPHPEQVSDAAFLTGEFFDARDVVQVKYEMVRAVTVDKVPVTAAAAAFGYSRPSSYQAAAALERSGLEGWCLPGPGRAGRTSSPRRSWPGPSRRWPPTPHCGQPPWPGRSRRTSACARTPGPSSERWPGTGNATPEAADLSCAARILD